MGEARIKIGIDLDRTITASVEGLLFFQIFTKAMNEIADICIIADRDPSEENYAEIRRELTNLNIKYYSLLLTSDKYHAIIQNKIAVYFSDSDEHFQNLPPEITVFKIREPGNFNFHTHKWTVNSESAEFLDSGGK